MEQIMPKTTIYYYSGTGNSLWSAKKLAEELSDTTVVAIVKSSKDDQNTESENVGIVFPVHMWGVPYRVIEFVKNLKINPQKYYFALAVNAGQVSATLLQLNKLMKKKGGSLSSGFDIVLPSNYIPWGGPGPIEKQQERIAAVSSKIIDVAKVVSKQLNQTLEKGPLWQRIVFTWFYKMTTPYIPKMDKNFRIDEKCNSCGICEKVCPAANILMKEGKPVWQKQCQQCLACIQWCPKESIQFGKKTSEYKRYHHPEIKLKEMTF
jgi:ferredoxin